MNVYRSREPGYTGPADGRSHPHFGHQRWLRPLARGLMSTLYRVEVEGADKLRQEGRTVYCPSHPGTVDPPLVATLIEGDTRYMANEILFQGPLGPVLTWAGAYPVDRETPARITITHSVDLVREGKNLVIFPEGGISSNPHCTNPLKTGSAAIALAGEADRIVPIGVHYERDTLPRSGEALVGALISLGVAASAFLGGPAGMLTGAAIGGCLTGKLVNHAVKQTRWFNPLPRQIGALVAGFVGGALGAAVGPALLQHVGPVVQGAAGGAAAWTLATTFRHRDRARVKVGDPIPLDEYRVGHRKDQARALTERLYQDLSGLKASLSGIPVDPRIPPVRTGAPTLEWTLADPVPVELMHSHG